MIVKWFMAGAVIGVYAFFPGYRYYVIGSWIAYKMMQDKQRYRIIRKGTREYKRILPVKVEVNVQVS